MIDSVKQNRMSIKHRTKLSIGWKYDECLRDCYTHFWPTFVFSDVTKSYLRPKEKYMFLECEKVYETFLMQIQIKAVKIQSKARPTRWLPRSYEMR